MKLFLGGWIHGLAFNKTGNRLCWVAHDSSITVADVSKGSIVVNKLKTNELPFISCIWVSDQAIVAAVSYQLVHFVMLFIVCNQTYML